MPGAAAAALPSPLLALFSGLCARAGSWASEGWDPHALQWRSHRLGWGERPCHCSGLWGLSPSHRVRLECTSLQRSWCLPAASLRQSSRWPDLSRERRCGWSRGEQPVVCALSTARAGGRLGGLPGTALTDQLQGQDAVRHCPLDVVVASGRVIIPCEKVGLEEGSVWGSSGGSWSTYGTRKNHGFLNFSSCLS